MTPPRPHEELEELIAAEALGGLDEDGRREMLRVMADHGPDCPQCIRLTTDYSELAANLGLSVDPAPLSAGAEEALLRAAREEERAPEGLAVIPSLRPSGSGRWIAAVAVAAVLALLAGAVGYSIAPGGPGRQDDFLAFVSRPGTEVVPFPATEGQQLAVALNPGIRHGWVFGTNLPKPAGDRVYELWFSSTDSDGVQPAGTFVPTDGIVLSPVTIGEAVDLLAVSIEPRGGSLQPTTTPVFVAEV
jgi:anti-sigma-K factor RskA